MRKALFALPVLAAAACSTVHHTSLRPDYDQVDKTKTVRLAVYTSPVPEGGEDVAKLWNQIARKYTNDHRDFIVKLEQFGDVKAGELCREGIEGVLRLVPKLHQVGTGVEAEVQAKITRCSDNEVVWAADAGGTFPSDDENLKETTQHYVDALGGKVKPYVAPSFLLLKATLDTLPTPKLPNDEAVMEKIELAE